MALLYCGLSACEDSITLQTQVAKQWRLQPHCNVYPPQNDIYSECSLAAHHNDGHCTSTITSISFCKD